jgi:hypothetical protein
LLLRLLPHQPLTLLLLRLLPHRLLTLLLHRLLLLLPHRLTLLHRLLLLPHRLLTLLLLLLLRSNQRTTSFIKKPTFWSAFLLLRRVHFAVHPENMRRP